MFFAVHQIPVQAIYVTTQPDVKGGKARGTPVCVVPVSRGCTVTQVCVVTYILNR